MEESFSLNSVQEKICQNCKQKFQIEPEDFLFYDKIKVPPPTFCPICRFQRRLMFRNDRYMYKRNCDLCGTGIITMFAPDKPLKVYCQPCWWSDKWDSLNYGMDYDPNRNFFEQFQELQRKVPLMSLVNGYATLVNSDYVNHAGYQKNSYLVFNSDQCENVAYGDQVNYVKDSADLNMVDESELCYEDINCDRSFNIFFSEDCDDCHDVYFSKNLSGCSNCFGCKNLRGKNYYIFNEPHSKEAYEEKIKSFGLDKNSSIGKIKKEVREFWLKYPEKYMHGVHNNKVSGEYVYQCKNSYNMYQTQNVEDSKYCQFITLKPVKDSYDFTEWGNGVEQVYEVFTTGEGASKVKFCAGAWSHVSNVEYSMYTISSSDIFGSVGLRNKKFCILNKQYSKEDFDELKAKIIQDMSVNPYTDKMGRVWKYGEFFPYDLALFDYNESTVSQHFPLTREEVIARGWRWRDAAGKNGHQITLPKEKVPDSIHDVDDSILQEIMECNVCQKAFRVIPQELALLRRFGFPLPRQCADCRNLRRKERMNPPYLWNRNCGKCGISIITSYSPNRPEIVYCEACYQAEII